jgi:RNA polymerase sigma factor (sigma-70 family)
MTTSPVTAFLRHLRRLTARQGSEHLSDRQLLRHFTAQGDEAAFATLVYRHGPSVLAVGRRVLHDRHAAEDVFQATFLVLARKAASIRKRQALASWLYGVAYRLAVRAKAQAGKRMLHERAQRTPPSEDPARTAAWRELVAVLDEELARLPDKYRAPLVLCYLEGKTQEAAARQLGWALSTLHDRLERGRERLRVRLEGRGVALSAGLLATALSQQAAEAAVSAALLDVTVEAALAFGAGGTVTAAASTQAMLLAKGVVHAMYVTKLKAMAVAIFAVGVLGLGTGKLTHSLLAGKPAAEGKAEAAKPPAKAVEKSIPAEAPQARTDRYGDPLPEGALARLGTTRLRHVSFHPTQVRAFAYFPDGKTLASGGTDDIIRLWDVATGKTVGRIATNDLAIFSIAISPDGKTILAGGRDDAMKPGRQDYLCLWDAATGTKIRRFEGHRDGIIWRAAFAPDGKIVASVAGDQTLRLWDVPTGKELRRFEGPKLETAVFSPDGAILAYSDGPSIRLWEVATGKERRRLQGHRDGVWALAFSPRGDTLASGGEDHSVRLWDVATGQEIRQYHGHAGLVSSVSFSPDGATLVSAGLDGTIRVWDVGSGRELRRCGRAGLAPAGDPIRLTAALSPDGKTLASAGEESAVSLWDAASGEGLHRCGGHQASVNALAFAPDGRALTSAGYDGTVLISGVTTGKEIHRRSHPERGSMPPTAFSLDGKTVAWVREDQDGGSSIRLRGTATGGLLCHLRGHRSYVNALAFSPDGKTLASGSILEETTRLWDVASGKEIRRFATGRQEFQRWYSLAFSPDGKTLAAGVEDRGIFLWEIATGRLLHRIQKPIQGDPLFVSRLAFSPNGRILAVQDAGSSLTYFFEAATGGERSRLETGLNVESLAFSPDGKVLATGYSYFPRSRPTICLWDVASGRRLEEAQGHQGSVPFLAFSPDGKVLASGSTDTTVLTWDVARLLREARREEPAINSEESALPLVNLWEKLASSQSATAAPAIWALAGAPRQTVPFLKDHLCAVPPGDPLRIAQLVKAFDSDRFADREEAARALERMGEAAEPELRKVLAGRPSLEIHRRVKRLVERLEGHEWLRKLRALEVLEYVGTLEARQVLEALAQGAPQARLTQEGKASLERLAKRPAISP